MNQNDREQHKNIVCSRYNNSLNIVVRNNQKRTRIGSKHIKNLEPLSYELIATNGTEVYSKNGNCNLRNFFNTNSKEPLMVLTLRERDLIHSIAIETSRRIYVFEVLFPIFKEIKYISNIKKSYEYLTGLYKKVVEGETKGIALGKYYSTHNHYAVERKLKSKNNLDIYFAYAYKTGYQEVFKIKEERKNRSIIALDFNSMFASCMLDRFMEPKSLRYIPLDEIDKYEDCLVHVTLEGPKNEFIKKFHPFKYVRLFNKHTFRLESTQSVEVLLFKDEFYFYRDFFQSYTLHKAIGSSKMINHPLSQKIKKLYGERLLAKENNDRKKERSIKFQLSVMHSSTNQKKYIHLKRKPKLEIKEYIQRKFLLDEPDSSELSYVKEYHGIEISKNNDFFDAKVLNLESLSNVYSLSSRITSRAELKMVKTMQSLLDFETLELCYCNTDSIHISLDNNTLNDFYKRFKGLIGDEMGQAKVDATSEKGYWFDVGRYWLINENEVVKFANILFNRPGESAPFIFNSKMHYHVKSELIDYSSIVYKNVFSTFSSKKALDVDLGEFKRYSFDEIRDLKVANKTYLNEHNYSREYKAGLIKSLPLKCALT